MVLAASSLGSTLANAVVRGDARRAAALAPNDGRIAAAAAQDLFASSVMADSGGPAIDLARSAVLADPTAVEALTVLAMQASLKGDTVRSDALYGQVGKLTRRELRTQMWGIEAAVSRGDVRGALHNYDLALRTSSAAAPILFPTLASALSEARIRQELLAVLKPQSVWGPEFLTFLATSMVDPRSARLFFADAGDAGIAIGDDLRLRLVDKLIASRAFDDAFLQYLQVRPGTIRAASRDRAFTTETNYRSAFDWNSGEAPGISAAILPARSGGAVDFAVSPQAGGIVLEQLQLLPAGRYRLNQTIVDLEAPRSAMPYWTLLCETGAELGRVPTGDEATSSPRVFTVAKDCPVQRLVLIVRPTDSPTGITGRVTTAALIRVPD